MTHYKVTKEHERREEELADFVSQHWNCICKLQRKFSIYDAVARPKNSQKPRVYIEMRIVNYRYDNLKEIMIPMSKLILGQQQTQMTGVPSLFMVHWYDCKTIGYVDVNNIECIPDYRVTFTGTNRTNDKEEIEVCRFVPREVFTILRRGNELDRTETVPETTESQKE